MPETSMKVTEDTVTVTVSALKDDKLGREGQTVQLKDADPSELQLFLDKMPASVKGKSK